MAAKKKPTRKPRKSSRSKTIRTSLTLTRAEYLDLKQAADDANMSVPEWSKLVLLHGAGRHHTLPEAMQRAAEAGQQLMGAALTKALGGSPILPPILDEAVDTVRDVRTYPQQLDETFTSGRYSDGDGRIWDLRKVLPATSSSIIRLLHRGEGVYVDAQDSLYNLKAFFTNPS